MLQKLELPTVNDYGHLFLSKTPMLDLRSPIEYDQGAFPHTQNIPLMSNEERRLIGIEYKKNGQQAAIELGKSLISGDSRTKRIEQWVNYFDQNPQAVLYCFRGGLRSRITQQWIYEESGMSVPRITGGYKKLRQFLIDVLETANSYFSPLLISGRTGSGKTKLLQTLSNAIDLEDIYKHRGSAFGIQATPQAPQISTENQLAITLLEYRKTNTPDIILEDESGKIGSRNIPDAFFKPLQLRPLLILETELQQRVDIVHEDYIVNSLADYQTMYGLDEGFQQWSQQLILALDKIQRRLGGIRYNQLKLLLESSINRHQNQNDTDGYKDVIAILLHDYYDPMYDYQLSKKWDRVIFKGCAQEITHFLSNMKA